LLLDYCKISHKYSALSYDIEVVQDSLPLDLAELLPSWEVSLAAEHKSPQTIKSYGDSVRGFIRWCHDNGHTPALDRKLVQGFIAALLAGGAEPATARARQLGIRRFSAWLAEEDEIDTDPLLGLKPPKLDTKVTQSLTDDELRRLIKACNGKDFRDRRDEAIVRLMAETGIRAGEVIAMTVADLDPVKGMAIIRRGKGGRGRTVPFSPQTARAVDRYVRMRRSHRLADTPALWLGERGQGLAYYGLRRALGLRADRAGIAGFHPHLMRHTAASRWLAAGGSEGGLMALAGWQSREMLDRYTRSTASDRAAAEARGLNLGEL
jgi:site-specific recombinase XerD